MMTRGVECVRDRLVIASHNDGKIAELRGLLAAHGVEVLGLPDLPGAPDPDEPHETFRENACHKALVAADFSGLPALADDSGLMVDALNGRPGVYSSRYGSDDQQRIRRLLGELEGVPGDRRGAHFVCVIALAVPGRVVGDWEGRCDGSILTEPRGDCGFGYDPVFYSPEAGASFAELPGEAKGVYSHRGRALRAMLADLPALLQSGDCRPSDRV